LVQIQLGPN